MIDKKTQQARGVIIVLGGAARKNKDGNWRTTLFEQEGDRGDQLRVIAAVHLYREKKIKPLLIASGGRGTLPSEAPPVAAVLSQELFELGVPSAHIVAEEQSRNTYEQLCGCIPLFPCSGEVAIVSNEYHLPRIRALIEHGPRLSLLKELCLQGRLSLMSAEAVLVGADEKKWRGDIEKWYRLPLVKEIMRNEKKGTAQIRAGSYVFV